MASTLALLRRLTNENVEFVLVGGMAAVVHGSASVTEDVDVCIRFDVTTLERVFRALAPLHPRQRMHPAKPPLGTDPAPFVGGRNLYVVTDEGVLDLLGELTGVGDFSRAAVRAIDANLGDFHCKVLGLDDLIACKQALGRPKDRQVAAELTRLREKLRG